MFLNIVYYDLIIVAIVNLSHERLSSDGLFLLENGCDLFLWIGRGVSTAILTTLFDTPSVEGLDPSLVRFLSY
jgi:protein transport protein SEC24